MRVKTCVRSINVPAWHVLRTWRFLRRLCSCLDMHFLFIDISIVYAEFSELTLFESKKDNCYSQVLCKQKERSAWGTVYQPRQSPFFHTETSRGSPSPLHTISYPNFSPVTIRSLPDRGDIMQMSETKPCRCDHSLFVKNTHFKQNTLIWEQSLLWPWQTGGHIL